MASLEEQTEHGHYDPNFPPGTLVLEKLQQATGDTIILHPVPTADPNDPLNWRPRRKAVNFGLCLLYVMLTYVVLDIVYTSWGQVQAELGVSVGQLNAGAALNFVGLGVGGVFFVPLMHKYGRRPAYVASSLLQLGGCAWLAGARRARDIWLGSLVSGLGGAVCETIVQVTVSDVFFVHQHAAMNALSILSTSIGAFLGPVAAGYVVDSQGWRWIWWWCAILVGAQTVLIVLFFEESKYSTMTLDGQQPAAAAARAGGAGAASAGALMDDDDARDSNNGVDAKKTVSMGLDRTISHRDIDETIPVHPYRKRMALLTTTPGRAFHSPLDPVRILFTFAAVAYAAVTFGSILATFSVLVSVQGQFLFEPPYNFTAAGVGLMNVAPLIGTLPGVCIGGYLNDRCIVWLSKRNGGVYEPEMRLWFMLPPAVLTPVGVLMLGLGIHHGVSWPVLAVGFGLVGFDMAIISSIALSYAMDCYGEIVGTAMIGIIFVRNALSVAALFALEPWINAMGLRDLHIIVAVVISAVLMIPALLLKWGKQARIRSAKAYYTMAQRQPTYREG